MKTSERIRAIDLYVRIAQLEEENEKLMKLLGRLYMAADDKIYEEVYLVLTPEGERIER